MVLKIKDFMGIFLGCFALCVFVVLFFGGLIFNNIWVMIVIFAFLMALFVTAFMSQVDRIEKLEEKMKNYCSDKE